MLTGEPPLNEDYPPQLPVVGDLIVVDADPGMGLAPGQHTLAITNIREGYSLFDCSTLDGELETQIFPSEIIDWRKDDRR